MKQLTIIGNGFDLAHHLPTSFDAFIQSNHSLFHPKYEIFRGDDGTWRNVETLYGNQLCEIIGRRSWYDITEVVEQILFDYGLNEYGEVDHRVLYSDAFEDEYQAILFRVNLLAEFEKDFQQYLCEVCSNIELAGIGTYDTIRGILMSSDRIINFNYTKTIEVAYGFADVDHIHGSVDTSIAIGSGALDGAKETMVDDKYPTIDKFGRDKYGLQELGRYYEYDDDGNRYPNALVEHFFNEVSIAANECETAVFDLLDVKNKDALVSRICTIDSLTREYYDRVYILGHSLGEADYAVFNAINKDAEVVCFYHTESEKKGMEQILRRLRIRYLMVPNAEIYR